MKILFAHQNYGDQGGAEVYVRDTARALSLRDHQCGLLFRDCTPKNIEAWNASFPRRWPAPSEAADAAVRSALDEFKPDVIFVNNESCLDILQALRRSKVPTVRVVHDHNLYCLRGYRYNYFTRKICTKPVGLSCLTKCLGCITRNGFSLTSYSRKKQELSLVRAFDHVVAVSNYIKDQLVLNGFEQDRISVIHPVPKITKLESPPRFGSENIILCPAQIIRGKGVDLLLRAVSLLEGRFTCVILGEGRHKAYCQRLAAKLGLDGRVIFEGYVPHDLVADYFSKASVVAVPSVWAEPCALVGVEAISLGLPVVAFDVGGNSDWLQTGINGFLVPAMNHHIFAQRLQALLQNKELCASMGRNGQKIAAAEFDFQTQLNKLEAVLERAENGLPVATSDYANNLTTTASVR